MNDALKLHDIKHDGKISFDEFKTMVTGKDQEEEDDDQADVLPEEGLEKNEAESIEKVKIT